MLLQTTDESEVYMCTKCGITWFLNAGVEEEVVALLQTTGLPNKQPRFESIRDISNPHIGDQYQLFTELFLWAPKLVF